MECDSCGRYVPSAQVLPALDHEGRMSMACARCRAPEPPLTAGPSVVLTPSILVQELPVAGIIV